MSEAVLSDPLLFIPGPSDVAPEVLAELGRQVVPHYGPAWAKEYRRVVDHAKTALQAEGHLFIYAGSGHLGLDAAIGSLFAPGEEVVAACNGFFGERLAELAHSHGIRVRRCEAPWGSPVAAEEIGRALDAHPEAKGVLVVHGETSTGVQNPVEAIAAEAKRRGRLVVVDAVSTAGVAPVSVTARGFDACVTASQKGLGAPPGVVLVTVSDEGWRAVEERKEPIRGWSANLAKWREHAFSDFQPYFITMPVNVVRALGKSLEMLLEEGLAERFARHREVSQLLRRSLREMGLSVIAPDACALPSVTAFRCPEGVAAPELRDALLGRGFYVSCGLGPWSNDVIRVGHMGVNATPERISRFIAALKRELHS